MECGFVVYSTRPSGNVLCTRQTNTSNKRTRKTKRAQHATSQQHSNGVGTICVDLVCVRIRTSVPAISICIRDSTVDRFNSINTCITTISTLWLQRQVKHKPSEKDRDSHTHVELTTCVLVCVQNFYTYIYISDRVCCVPFSICCGSKKGHITIQLHTQTRIDEPATPADWTRLECVAFI